MLYLASKSDNGLSIFLGLCAENIKQIKLDNPLIARLGYCGYRGLFFLSISEDGSDSRQLKNLCSMISLSRMKYYAQPICASELDDLQAGRCVLVVEPGEYLSGVQKIVVMFCEDQFKFAQLLRDKGMITKETEILVVPKDSSLN
jgi:hypothetical protein